MRKISYKPYVFLVLFSLFFLSLSQESSEKTRSFAVSTLGSAWRFLSSCGLTLSSWGSQLIGHPPVAALKRDIGFLKQENELLKSEIESLKQSLSSHTALMQEIDRLKGLSRNNPFFEKREKEILKRVDLYLSSLPARVIFREPGSWNSSLWINLGERDNHLLEKQVVAKNSPVVVGEALVGVVEYVGERKSRVRLITDPGLNPSVRALRAQPQKHEDLYLAKGVLYGNSKSLFRLRSHHLRGVGFNYDFADSEGPARSLKTAREGEVPLLKEGDLLVTTGMDGIFPAGLKVAIVTEVEPLREGSCSYDIEAKSILSNLEGLNFVTVLPPVSPS